MTPQQQLFASLLATSESELCSLGAALSVGRLRGNTERDARLAWRGLGYTAFAGDFGFDIPATGSSGDHPSSVSHDDPGRDAARDPASGSVVPLLVSFSGSALRGGGEGVELGAASEVHEEAKIEIEPANDAATQWQRFWTGSEPLFDFLRCGARRAVILDEPRLASAAATTSDWIGEEERPGLRTGVYQLADLQAVTTVVLSGLSSARRQRVVELAKDRPDKFFVLLRPLPPAEAAAEFGGSLRWVRPNTIELWPPAACGRPGAAGEWRVKGPTSRSKDLLQQAANPFWTRPGALCAALESTDFRDELSYSRHRSAAFPRAVVGDADLSKVGAADTALRALEAWRRWEGLRRSLEFGTRWVVMELHHPMMRRRVEREVQAFLRHLAAWGLLREPRHGFDVTCSPAASRLDPDSGELNCVDIRVDVQLAPPFDGYAQDAYGVGFERPARRVEEKPRSGHER